MFAQVVNGMSAREAWEACDKPNGDAGIQNIRKRAREEKLRREAAAAEAEKVQTRARASPVAVPVTPAALSEADPSEAKRREPVFRLKSSQVAKQKENDRAMKEEWGAAYAGATAEWQKICWLQARQAAARSLLTRWPRVGMQSCPVTARGSWPARSSATLSLMAEPGRRRQSAGPRVSCPSLLCRVSPCTRR